MAEAAYTDGETETEDALSVAYQRIPLGHLDSQVSTDAVPMTPISSVRYDKIPSCVCPTSDQPDVSQLGQDNTEPVSDQRSHPLTHSRTYPELCLKCNKPRIKSDNTSPISETHSYPDLSTRAVSNDEDENNLHSMPDKLKIDYYDVMIMYAVPDRDGATEYLKHLRNDIRLKDRTAIKAVLYDGPELAGLSGLELEQLDLAFRRCSYTFIYLTKNFVKDIWCKISHESMFMRTVYDQKKNWRVLPVYTMRRGDCDFKIPFGIIALKGLSFYDPDEFYRKGVASLIEKTVPERLWKEKRLTEKRKAWEEIHGPCQLEWSHEYSPNSSSNGDLLDHLPTQDGQMMVQPQQSVEMDYSTFTDTGMATPSTDKEKDFSYENAPGPSSAVVSESPCAPTSTCTSTTSNVAQSTNSVNIDLKLKCDNTDSIKIGIDVMKTKAAETTSNTQCSGAIVQEEETSNRSWHCRYYVKELFCRNYIHSSHILGWHCYFSFINEHLKSTESFSELSKDSRDPLD